MTEQLLTMIVMPDERRSKFLRTQVSKDAPLIIVAPTVGQLSGRAPHIILVHPDVDLNMIIEGVPLWNLLKARQRLHKNPHFMVMPS